MKRMNFSVLKRLLWDSKPYWKYFLIAIIGTLMLSAVDAGFTWMMKPLLNDGFINRNEVFIRWLPPLVISIFLMRALAGFLSSYYVSYISASMVKGYRQKIFNHYLSLPTDFFDKSSTGNLLSTIIYNVTQLANATSDTLISFLRESMTLVGLVVIMFVLNWQFSALFFMVVPFVVWVVSWSTKRMRRLSQQLQITMGDVTTICEQAIENHKIVRVFNGQACEKRKLGKALEENFKRSMKSIVTNTLSGSLVQLLVSIPISLTLLFATMPNVQLSAGSFAAIIAAMISLLRPFKRLSGLNNAMQQGLAGAESVFRVLDLIQENDKGSHTVVRAQGSLCFEQLSFQYSSSPSLVLTDINLQVKPGETIALVGRSGSGKSTLVSLLPRFYEVTQGQILMDGINIADYRLSDLRKQISIVSQQTTLFNDTIANNIAYGLEVPVSSEQLNEVIKAAYADEFISKLPEGVNTVVGENGVLLSGGQRQRIAIARALLKQAPILILDEATSALDSHSERHIQSALELLMKQTTAIVIAHRLSTIENADRIFVMDHGRIIEAGSHNELMALSGAYSELRRIQFREDELQQVSSMA